MKNISCALGMVVIGFASSGQAFASGCHGGGGHSGGHSSGHHSGHVSHPSGSHHAFWLPFFWGHSYAGNTAVSNSATVPVRLQAALAKRGYYHGDLDGIIGPQSRRAISEFQRQNRMPVTGYIDEALLQALGLK